jgi:hypothetical protein
VVGGTLNDPVPLPIPKYNAWSLKLATTESRLPSPELNRPMPAAVGPGPELDPTLKLPDLVNWKVVATLAR